MVMYIFILYTLHKVKGTEANIPTSVDIHPESKVHGANMGPIWGRQDPGGPHVGPMTFAIWVFKWFIAKMGHKFYGCHYDNLRCRQWQQICCHGNSRFQQKFSLHAVDTRIDWLWEFHAQMIHQKLSGERELYSIRPTSCYAVECITTICCEAHRTPNTLDKEIGIWSGGLYSKSPHVTPRNRDWWLCWLAYRILLTKTHDWWLLPEYLSCSSLICKQFAWGVTNYFKRNQTPCQIY